MTFKDYNVFAGHKLKVYFKDGTAPIIGLYEGITPAYDNEPEVASLELQPYEGAQYGYTLYENEIAAIEFAD